MVGLLIVYGADGVTSGASSDLQRATQVASAMVKVRHFVVLPHFGMYSDIDDLDTAIS